MKNIIYDYLPLFTSGISWLIAQLLKPITHLIIHKEFKPSLIFASGGLPSSHSSLVCGLAFGVGVVDNFNSTLFCVTLIFASVICYDAANVRYYAGQNISLTKHLIEDLKTLTQIKLNDPIYHKKMKDVLGHTYFEVFGGIIVGLTTSVLFYFVIRGIYG